MLILERPWSDPAFATAVKTLRTFSNCGFLWAPGGSRENIFRDQAKGLIGKPVAPSVFNYGGVQNPIANGGGGLMFATNAGITGTNTPFLGVILVSVPNPAAVTGCFLKIGDSNDGIGFGGGATTFLDSGTEQILLREGIAWEAASSGTFVKGLNILTIGRSITTPWFMVNHSNGTFNAPNLDWAAPAAELYINGYDTDTARSSNCTVHAVAIYNQSLDNTAIVTARNALAQPFLPWSGTDVTAMRRKFAPRRIYIPTSAAAASAPTITVLSARLITAASAQPQITYA